jgi:hypothetical protein
MFWMNLACNLLLHWFLLSLFNSKVEIIFSPQNIGWLTTDYMALYPRKWYSSTSVNIYQTTSNNIPEDFTLHTHCSENLKSTTVSMFLKPSLNSLQGVIAHLFIYYCLLNKTWNC